MKCRCELGYCPDIEEDRGVHARLHDEWLKRTDTFTDWSGMIAGDVLGHPVIEAM